MDLYKNIDLYCERVGTHFWAEPMNAYSNIAISIAGLIGIYLAMKSNHKHTKLWLNSLGAIAVVTGLGSFLFHTYANTWSMFMDVLPIFIFQVSSLYYILVHLIKHSKNTSMCLLATFIFTTIYTGIDERFTSLINGSFSYIPSLAFLIYLAIKLKIKESYYLVASFFFSLTMRTIDNTICEAFPIGTHFIWHIFNGVTIFLVLYMLYNFSHNEHTEGKS